MRWHAVTPQGRMFDRFSKDVVTVETSLANTLRSVNSWLAAPVASVFTVIVILPLFVPLAVIIGLITARSLAIGYLDCGCDLLV
ncbi:hypothetical protein EUX98_g9345 [Antrodiella citrinella]|uniref:ABC transmembrane type-1 domain-containing protein n=1 Tax=Antrodiella citrinella TaxID=2447956 RepID=A0A4S4M0E3_9APHY|nr:hypothetical protein EUX98_g9345 [Antrodiella citrinella]